MKTLVPLDSAYCMRLITVMNCNFRKNLVETAFQFDKMSSSQMLQAQYLIDAF
jgi:hypothetical protein